MRFIFGYETSRSTNLHTYDSEQDNISVYGDLDYLLFFGEFDKDKKIKLKFSLDEKSDEFIITFNSLSNYSHIHLESGEAYIDIDMLIIDDFIKLPGQNLKNLPDRFVIGHRGSGNNLIVKNHLENTIPAFMDAYKNGARCVEMDVQLAYNDVPIVIHPFTQALPHKSESGKEPIKIDNNGNFIYPNQYITTEEHKKTGLDTDFKTERCTYEEVLTQLPEDMSILTEVKYPCSPELEKQIPFQERNRYVEILFESLAKFGNDRIVILGSFDPTLTVSFAVRQDKYPVALLINPSPTEDRAHLRTRIRAYLPLLQKLGIKFISTDPKNLLPEPEIIKEVLKHGVKIMTYFSDAQTKEYYLNLFKLGINVIISDFIQPFDEAVELLKQFC